MLQALKRMLLSVTVALTTSVTYGDYKHSSELSGFELAASKLGFTSPAQQEALLFYLSVIILISNSYNKKTMINIT